MLGWTWKSCEEFRYLPHGQVACGGEQPGWRYALYAPDRNLVQIGSQKYLMQNMQNINKIPALTSQLAVLRGCWLEYYTITPNSMLPRTVRDHYSMAGMKLVVEPQLSQERRFLLQTLVVCWTQGQYHRPGRLNGAHTGYSHATMWGMDTRHNAWKSHDLVVN